MKQLIAKFIADEQGQDIIEYALLGSFVSFGAYTGASELGTAYNTWFTEHGDDGRGGVGKAAAVNSVVIRWLRAAAHRAARSNSFHHDDN